MGQAEIDPITSLREKFSDRIKELYEKSEKRYYVLIEPADLLDFVDYVYNHLKARYIIVSGLDTPKGLELVYHFALDKLGKVLSLRTVVPIEKPEVESISGLITGAQWIEREIMDILGVKFLNHPDPRRFILADDWPEGVYPYRRKK